VLTAEQIADDLQRGDRDTTWEYDGTGDDLPPFKELAMGDVGLGAAIADRAFTGLLVRGIAEDRNPEGDVIPVVTPRDELRALELAEEVRGVLMARGVELPPAPEAWAADRERYAAAAAAEPVVLGNVDRSTPLADRMNDGYLVGYDERIQTGLSWAAATTAQERDAVGDAVLAGKTAAYRELDELRGTLDQELPDRVAIVDGPGLAHAPVSPAADAALERSAHLAGRWSGTDRGLDQALDGIESRLQGVPEPGSIYAGDTREVLFNYGLEQGGAAKEALPQIERRVAERAAGMREDRSEEAASGGMFERLRSWRDARREAGTRDGGDGTQRRREAWESAHGREMTPPGSAPRVATVDAAPQARERGTER